MLSSEVLFWVLNMCPWDWASSPEAGLKHVHQRAADRRDLQQWASYGIVHQPAKAPSEHSEELAVEVEPSPLENSLGSSSEDFGLDLLDSGSESSSSSSSGGSVPAVPADLV